jgi:hypothetical protein
VWHVTTLDVSETGSLPFSPSQYLEEFQLCLERSSILSYLSEIQFSNSWIGLVV